MMQVKPTQAPQLKAFAFTCDCCGKPIGRTSNGATITVEDNDLTAKCAKCTKQGFEDLAVFHVAEILAKKVNGVIVEAG